ncbi:DNA-binding protein [Paraburkholderia sp. Ac-20340]|uniref:DNA-binding protein n=1 Tax=Paraburkholderia sp. Ac-20340 TaxID=2703888 RepID=UPI00197F32B7|nr:DNA-binding protein [Paraburkholderia sp. Ac-20340]MBN3851994.1 DNA-binding protein [Paraburkholderia sp. Ac-20340]
MSETTEKLFRTPQDALVFAFNYSMQRQDRSLVDRMAAPSPRTGKGLSGNDGAGQAGMIRRELEQLSELDRAVLAARFAPKSWPCACGSDCCSGHMPNPEYVAAIRTLEQAALAKLAGHLSHYRLRRRLVEKAMGVKVEISTLAKECGVSENTASAHWKIVREWICGVPKPKAKAPAKRVRVATDGARADAVLDEEAESAAVLTAVDGIESLARKRADDLLSTLPFMAS